MSFPTGVVLVVEDNPFNLELVGDLLRVGGYEVLTAEDAEQCLKVLQTQRPDLILMDIQLPQVDGYTLTHQIKQNPEWKDIPVLAVTAFAMQKDYEQAMNAGCAEVITKPINTRSFLSIIQRYFKK